MIRRGFLIVLCLVFLCIAGFSGYQIYLELSEYRAGEDTYDDLLQYVQTEAPTPEPPESENVPQATATEPTETAPPARLTVDFEALQAFNPDIVGWIYMEDTVINYPIVQGPDNDKYLRRMVDGTYNRSGSIFLDYKNRADLTDRHTIIYGHNMRNDSMFASLTNYKKQSYYESHPSCQILTPGGNYELRFFAGYVTASTDDAWRLSFSSDEAYAAWLEDAVKKSTFSSSITPTAQDRVVTLSTCSYDFDDARYVLLGILVPIE